MSRPVTIDIQTLAAGPGWCVREVACTAGPQDRPFEERHGSVCIAAVARGTFQYRTTAGEALLAPGAVLLGNHGHCFQCGHTHGVGDHCVSVQMTPAHWEEIVAAVPGARTTIFGVPRLPPLPALTRQIASLEAACRSRGAGELEELAHDFAGATAEMLAGPATRCRTITPQVERRISDAVRRIESEEPGSPPIEWSLVALAREAAMSPYHFLRVFRDVVGMTPHQYVLHLRMHRAAVRLRRSDDPVSAIAFDAGFNDLSTFNRRFRRIIGATPTAYRRGSRTGTSA